MALFNLAFVRQQRRAVPAAHRGHRPRALRRRQRAADLRHAALARPRLGRGPGHRRPVRPVPPVRAARPPTRPTPSGCSPTATPTAAGAAPSGSREMREAQQKAKQPTGYDRLCFGKTREERARAAGVQRARRWCGCCVPDDGAADVRDLIRGEVRAPRPDDQVLSRPTASRPTTWPASSTTTRWASPTSCAARSGSARRRSTSCSTVARRRAAEVRAHAAAAQRRQVARSASARTRRRG